MLIIAGILLWIFVWPILGIILLILGIIDLFWAGPSFRGGGPRRWYY